MDPTNDPVRVEDGPERDERDAIETPRERDHELAEAHERRGAHTSAAPETSSRRETRSGTATGQRHRSDQEGTERKDGAAPRHDLPAGTRRGASTSNPGDRQMESGRTTASPEERAQPQAARPPAA